MRRFPSNSSDAEDSFDDAYLSGEIVSILMKNEKFDDSRLVEHMVKWGRVMGIGELIYVEAQDFFRMVSLKVTPNVT